MKRCICFLSLLFASIPTFLLSAKQPISDPEGTYSTENRLFYIERLKNKNIVCYDINLVSPGVPDTHHPVKVYWINREEHPGQKEELNAVEEKKAFGYQTISVHNDVIEIALNASKDKILKIVKHGNNYMCQVVLGNHPSQLDRIYVKTKHPNSLSVEYVEVSGTDIASRKARTERITQ